MAEWKIRVGDVVVKAASIAELREWVREKRLLPENYVFHPVLERWMYVKDLEELKAELSKFANTPFADAFLRLRDESGLRCRVVELDKYLWLAGQHRTLARGGRAAEILSPEVVKFFRSKDQHDRQLVAALVGEAGRADGKRNLPDQG